MYCTPVNHDHALENKSCLTLTPRSCMHSSRLIPLHFPILHSFRPTFQINRGLATSARPITSPETSLPNYFTSLYSALEAKENPENNFIVLQDCNSSMLNNPPPWQRVFPPFNARRLIRPGPPLHAHFDSCFFLILTRTTESKRILNRRFDIAFWRQERSDVSRSASLSLFSIFFPICAIRACSWLIWLMLYSRGITVAVMGIKSLSRRQASLC